MRVTGLGAETARLNTLGGQWCVCLIRIAPSPGGVSATACPGGGSRHRPIRLEGGGGGEGGFGTQTFVYQKWPDKTFPIVNFIFFFDGHWSGGGGGMTMCQASPSNPRTPLAPIPAPHLYGAAALSKRPIANSRPRVTRARPWPRDHTVA